MKIKMILSIKQHVAFDPSGLGRYLIAFLAQAYTLGLLISDFRPPGGEYGVFGCPSNNQVILDASKMG